MANIEQLGPVKFADIDVGTEGANTVVAAVSGKKLRVFNYTIAAAAAVRAQWFSGSPSSSQLSGEISLAQNGNLSAYSSVGLMETVVGEALQLYLWGGAVQVSGHLAYREVTPAAA